MNKAKLTYFDVRGLAEPARLMLEDAGVEYENRFVTMEEWPRLKPDFKFGQMPVYSDENHCIEESLAIYGYLARKFDLVPKTEKELIRHDQVASLTRSSNLELVLLFWDPAFQEKQKEMRESKLPMRLENLEKFHAETTGPFWIGDKVHDVDYQVWCYLDTVRLFDEKILDGFPRLAEFKQAFESRPRVNAYLRSDRRPKQFTVAKAPYGGQIDEWLPAEI